jgi:hypothetical protein
MTDGEKQWLKQKYEQILPEQATLYIPTKTDVEHFFCSPAHIAVVAQIEEEEAQEIIDSVLDANQAPLAAKLAKKRVDLSFKALKAFQDRASTDDLVANGVGFDLALGKLLMPKILNELQAGGTPVGDLLTPSAALIDAELEALAPE